MTDIFRHVETNGKTTYSDQPPVSPGRTEVVTPGGRRPSKSDEEARNAHDQAVKYIKEAQKRVPKLLDYLEYAEYLRRYHPFQLEHVLQKLQREDPQTYLKLQQYPQFRPLRNTALGLKAADKHIAAGIGLMTGNITGSAEKWLETTVKDMMKRDRFGPYADVLGSKASTLPEPKPTYSNSRLGQYLKVEDPRAAQAAKDAAKAMESSHAAVRTGVATSITRTGNVLLNLGIGALDPTMAPGVAFFRGRVIAKNLYEKGILSFDEADQLPRMMARLEFDKVTKMIEEGAARASAGR